ncbi:abortive infection family protein [Francisella sp. XLW-1]|uniref:abortive infection family protein n=1 Tax=Francisella sp. XLW-1 TaxID=2610887 RepID=UPI00123DB225|nr:abortive infection family protein [Francisella sp. XLW-1]
MDKLKKIISKYNHWQDINTYIDRVEAEIDTDFGVAIGNAKAILETVSKHICDKKDITVKENISMNGLIKQAFDALDGDFKSCKQIGSALSTIAQEIGSIRNNIDITSHGKSLDKIQEIQEKNKNISLLTKEFLLGAIDIVSSFLIESFETKNVNIINQSKYIEVYDDNVGLNEFIDEKYGEVMVGEDYSYSSSEVLFHLDKEVYKEEYNLFIDSNLEEIEK